MSSFFDSEIVQEEMHEIAEMQREVCLELPYFNFMRKPEKEKHINKILELIEKQRVLFTRFSLTDDSDAKALRETFINTMSMMGYGESSDIQTVLLNMKEAMLKYKAEVLGLDIPSP